MSTSFSKRAIIALTTAAISTSGFTAVAPSALATPAAVSYAADEAPASIAEDSLDWGFKASWRSYVTNPWVGGSATASNGASVNEDGTYTFILGAGSAYDAETATGQLNYEGTIEFESEAHGFAITLADPHITVDGDSAILSAELSDAADPSNDATSRVDVAEFTLDAPEVTETDADTTFTWTNASGVFLESLQPAELSRYAGQDADALSFSITVDNEVETPDDNEDDDNAEVTVGSSANLFQRILDLLHQLASPLLKLLGSFSS
ncbi:hypothetical protein CDES_12800 [Corynebacterium deserti GIMN1.010]|uniref:Htaa domain-containing protein n=1 Tax=Corynebacterium deserti GIMN1.010 TaxID=931089 RepID=A0A0M4CFI8_9CORY|nr:HtaA domain-containing protein [Corynebacterium deserti]ALC06904.1 hypothetical protein CDES_12800 [Corynebacterium deserti GIMN1.010]